MVVADTSGCVIVRGNWVLEKCQTLPGLEHMTNTHVLELWVILKLSVLMCRGCKHGIKMALNAPLKAIIPFS